MKKLFTIKKLSMKIMFIIGAIILIVSGSIAFYMQYRILTEIGRHTNLLLEYQTLELEEKISFAFIDTVQNVESFRNLAATYFDMDEFKKDPMGYSYYLNERIGDFFYHTIDESPHITAAYFTLHPSLTDHRFVSEIYYYRDEGGINYAGLLSYDEYIETDPDMEWFYEPFNSSRPYWAPLYIGDTGELMVSYTVPVFVKGEKVGVAGADITVDSIKNLVGDIVLYETGFALLEDRYGEFFETNDLITRLSPAERGVLSNAAQASGGKTFEIDLGTTYLAAARTMANDYTVYIMAPKREVNAETTASVIRFVIIFITAYSIVLVVAYFIGKPIGRRLSVLSTFMKRAASTGDLSLRREDREALLRFTKQKDSVDEIDEVARDFYALVDVIQSMIDDLSNLSHELNDNGDIDYRIDTSKYKGTLKIMADGLNAMIAGIVDDITEILHGVTALYEGKDAHIRNMPGKKAAFTERFNQLQTMLGLFMGELSGLTKSAINGNLNIQADTSKYQGEWADMMNEMNALVRAVSEPLKEIEETLIKMSKGEFIQMTGEYKGDFDVVKQAVNETCEKTLAYVKEITHMLDSISNGDLTARIKQEYIGSYEPIWYAFAKIFKSLNNTMSEIDAAAAQVLTGAEQISKSATNLADGTSRQASSIEELNASIETINEKTKLNANRAKDANNLSQQSNEHAAHSNDEMKSMVTSMESIKASSETISKIIKMIEDIAFQTNLLALNASVEAARAGEHGKGFAVVADEVRSLAAKSQQSANETTGQITESINRINDGMNAAQAANQSLDTIVTHLQGVSGLISQIAQLSEEQAESIMQITAGINEISSVVQSNAATSEECAAASQELNSQAQLLQQHVSFFKLRNKG
jgi:methyl-accepting chemotaxis protein